MKAHEAQQLHQQQLVEDLAANQAILADNVAAYWKAATERSGGPTAMAAPLALEQSSTDHPNVLPSRAAERPAAADAATEQGGRLRAIGDRLRRNRKDRKTDPAAERAGVDADVDDAAAISQRALAFTRTAGKTATAPQAAAAEASAASTASTLDEKTQELPVYQPRPAAEADNDVTQEIPVIRVTDKPEASTADSAPAADNSTSVTSGRRHGGKHTRRGAAKAKAAQESAGSSTDGSNEAPSKLRTAARKVADVASVVGPAGLAARWQIAKAGLTAEEASGAYNLLPRSVRAGIAGSNIAFLGIAGATLFNLTRSAVGTVMAVKYGTEMPGSTPGNHNATLEALNNLQQTGGTSPDKLHLAAQAADLGHATMGQASHGHNTIDVSALDTKGAHHVSHGEGWYSQLKQMGMNQEQAEDFLHKHGAELEERGLAYRRGNSWGMNYDPHHNGTSDFSTADADWFKKTMAHDGLLPDQTDDTLPHDDGHHPAGNDSGAAKKGEVNTFDPHFGDDTNHGSNYHPRHGLSTTETEVLATVGAGFVAAETGNLAGRRAVELAVERARAEGRTIGRHNAEATATAAAAQEAAQKNEENARRAASDTSEDDKPHGHRQGRRALPRIRHQGRHGGKPATAPAERTDATTPPTRIRDRIANGVNAAASTVLPRAPRGKHTNGSRRR